MSPEQILCLILIFAGLAALAWLWREAALDFAEQRFAEDALGQAPHGDMPFIGADDLKALHANPNITGVK